MLIIVPEVELPCPECGSPLDIVERGEKGEHYAPAFHTRGQPIPIRVRPATFAACTGCEFCMEIR